MDLTHEADRLLERETELEKLEALVRRAAAGQGSTALIEGSAGIGKTRLLAAVEMTARDAGLEVIRARGGELEADIAYGLVRQLFEPAVVTADEATRVDLLGGAAAFASPLLGIEAPGDRHATLLGDDPTATALHGLYWLTANLAARRPLLISVDDAHWGDSASLRFLVYLGRRVAELPVSVVATMRPAIESPAVELLDRLRPEPGTASLRLSPLSEQAGALLVRDLFGDDAGEGFARDCHEATAGNPFLLRELAASLRGRRAGPQAALSAWLEAPLSRSISGEIVARVGRVEPDAQALTRAVAVLGADAALGEAATLAGIDLDRAAAAADALAAADVLRPGLPLEFVHPLVRAAVHDGLPEGERSVLHARAAQILTDSGADPERIAPQLLACEAGAEEWRVAVLRDAAARSIERGAPDAAVRFLARALDEPPKESQRSELLAELGKAEVRAAMPDRAIEHLREALDGTPHARERARMAHDLAIGLVAPGRYREAVEMLVEAVEGARATDPELGRRLSAELISAARLAPDTLPISSAQVAGVEGGLSGKTRGERMLMATLAHEEILRADDPGEAERLATAALEGGLVGELGGDSSLTVDALFALIVASDPETAGRWVATALDDVRARGSVIGLARVSCFQAMLAYRRGDLAEASSDAELTIEIAMEPGYRVARMALSPLVDSLTATGDLDRADRELTTARLDRELPDMYMLNFVLHSRGWLRLAQGRIAESIADFEDLAERERIWRGRNPGVLAYRSGLALAVLRNDDGAQALAHVKEELELARTWGRGAAVGASLRTLGMIEGGENGIARLEESVAALQGSGARYELARSLIELGAALRRSGQRSPSRDPLRRGMELAHLCGADPLTERARQELLATGARPRRIMRTGVDALTPSEQRVVRLAADGKTNREVAQTLFVTMRTVEGHLTSAYRKLEIESRAQLAEAIARGARQGSVDRSSGSA